MWRQCNVRLEGQHQHVKDALSPGEADRLYTYILWDPGYMMPGLKEIKPGVKHLECLHGVKIKGYYSVRVALSPVPHPILACTPQLVSCYRIAILYLTT